MSYDTQETDADRVCSPPEGAKLRTYCDAVGRGRKQAADSSVAICALARDVANIMHRSQAQVDDIAGLFGHSHLFVCENDSLDSTRNMLMNWRPRVDSYKVLGKDWQDPIWPRKRDMARAERMAYYRQICHGAVISQCPDVDYVVVLDFDLACVSVRGLLHTLAQPAWDAVGSNGLAKVRGRYVQFDAWALRDFGSDRPLTWQEAHPRVLQAGQPMLPVNSCFGGMAIYRAEAFRHGYYSGGDCEHVTFHRSLREAGYGRLYLNPSQVLLY